MKCLSAIALSLLMLTGCAIERNGTVHHVIIGFGVVSVPKTNDLAQVTKIRAVGVYAGNLIGPSCAAGYLSSTVTVVKQTNVLIEIK